MSRGRRRWLPQSVGPRLLCWFLALSLIPAATLTAVQYRLASRSLRETASARLHRIGGARLAQMETYAGERLAAAAVLARAPEFVEAATRLDRARRASGLGSKEFEEALRAVRGPVLFTSETLGHPDVLIFATDGTTLLRQRTDLDVGANLREGPLKATALRALVDRVLMLLNPDVSRFEPYPGSAAPVGFVATPLFEPGGKLAGVAALRLDDREIARFFRDYDGLGRTGEVEAAMLEPDGETIRVISPERGRPAARDAEAARLGPGEAPDDPLWQAVRARRGAGVVVDRRGRSVLADWRFLPSYQWGLVVKQDLDEALELVRLQRDAALTLLGLTLLAAAVAALLVAGTLARPIRAAAGQAERVARGDLTGRLDADAPGEPGLLLRSLAAMTEYLRGLIGRIAGSSHLVLDAAGRIAEATREQERTIQETGAATYQTAASVHEITGTSRSLLETMDEVNGLSCQAARMADEGRESLREMARSMTALAEATAAVRDRLDEIRQRARDIDVVLGTVTKLADQADLLSLNAAIEAEKAGGAASGFRVVAQEIRHLADQSAISTLEIEKLVQGMHRSVDAGAEEMRRYDAQLAAGVERVAAVSGRLESVIAAVHDLSPRFENVTEGMRVQAQGASQIRDAMESLRDRMVRSGESVQAFKEAVAQLQAASTALSEDVARFQVETTTD